MRSDFFGQSLSCLRKRFGIECCERLQRRVGDAPAHVGHICIGTIKCHKVGIGRCAFEKRVHPTAVAILSFAFGPAEVVCVTQRGNLGGHGGKHARAPDLAGEQSRRRQMQVSHYLGLDAQAVLAREQAVERVDVFQFAACL